MEVGVDNNNNTMVVMEIPAVEGSELSSPPSIPPWLRRRLTGTKSSFSTVEEIEAKLRDAHLRRQVAIILRFLFLVVSYYRYDSVIFV
ncbi:T-complex protein 11 [Artemisia annua]|uniref:T-complex protein 11 n=1 Tax=Artemisia annua TaxID=35608 RepID=A0A2U1KJV6_ARTAN|nr:T-complex protein 11 [Artemisia annua]